MPAAKRQSCGWRENDKVGQTGRLLCNNREMIAEPGTQEDLNGTDVAVSKAIE
jgi:hypothetical protein